MENILTDGIKNVIFDFGCVIVDLDKKACIDSLNRIGAGPVAGYVDECKQTDMFLDLELGRISVSEFCDEVRRHAPGCTATDRQIAEAWGELLTGIPTRRLERLAELHKRYKLFMLSNSNPVHWDKAAERFFPQGGHEPEFYFDKIFLSYKMGLVKPDPRIFEQLLDETGIKPEETLFVDDSEANCIQAEKMGITSVNVANGDEWLNLLK